MQRFSLAALKQMAFGVAGIAFTDYFQMSDTTARKCLKDLCKIISTSPELCSKYLRSQMRADARQLSRMDEIDVGVPGCIGCLDCMHVYWRTCPRAWHGQYEGKEGSASIVLEAVADYTTKIWHTTFGFPGTLNDINIWDQSNLLKSFLDGSFSMINFPFEINGKQFQYLWIMVDGIYPELSRFVKNISVPLTEKHKKYSKWQESARKSVE
jgi:Plant transposon protein